MGGRLSSSLRKATERGARDNSQSLAVKNREAGGREDLPDVAGIG
jgi:hypothetical protein